MKELEIANAVNLPVEKIFELFPMPDTPQGVGHRIKKKRALGLDVTEELNHLKYMGLVKEIKELANRNALTPERVRELKELLSNERVSVGPDAQKEAN